jgi:hypothetical protein
MGVFPPVRSLPRSLAPPFVSHILPLAMAVGVAWPSSSLARFEGLLPGSPWGPPACGRFSLILPMPAWLTS